MRNTLTLAVCILFISSCTIKPKTINYGEDSCNYCRMTIVDRQFAAQIVTNKGKVFQFDAAECMINHMAENKMEVALNLVTDYTNPEKLIDANTSFFIVSPNIASPMKANLCAVGSEEDALKILSEMDGKAYSWIEIQQHLNRK